jgi:hypothetical protein
MLYKSKTSLLSSKSAQASHVSYYEDWGLIGKVHLQEL